MQNPFSLSFGREPISFIERGKQSRDIIEGFSGGESDLSGEYDYRGQRFRKNCYAD
jgi:hypothetical protein